jgi:hypothetical protein
MAMWDDLNKGLKSPMESVVTPATTQVRDEAGQPTDQLVSIPEDGDTKSADPQSWMTDKDMEKRTPHKKTTFMKLPGLGMEIFVVEMPTSRKLVADFVDDDIVPPGEIWINKNFLGSQMQKKELLKKIMYTFFVWKAGRDRDSAKRMSESIGKAMDALDSERE